MCIRKQAERRSGVADDRASGRASMLAGALDVKKEPVQSAHEVNSCHGVLDHIL